MIFQFKKNAKKSERVAVILGNSYAGAQYPGIARALEKLNFTKVYLITRPGCLPYGGVLNQEYSKFNCTVWSGSFYDDFLMHVKPEAIFISAR